MKKISGYFDYIYYRVAKAYSKWDVGHGSTGLWAVICCQMFLILDVLILLAYIFLNKSERIIFFDFSKYVLVLILITLFYFNYNRYKFKYEDLNNTWQVESTYKKILHGILVILAILLPIVIPMAIFSF